MKDVMVHIKNFLQTWARLDCKSERNDKSKFPEGSYNYLEHYLLKLAFISELQPRVNKECVDSTMSALVSKLPETALEIKAKDEEEEKKEEKPESFPAKVYKMINPDHGKTNEAMAKKGLGYSGYSAKGWDWKNYLAAQIEKDRQVESVLEKVVSELQGFSNTAQSRTDELYDVLKGSALIPFLESKLRDNNFLEICQHPKVYQYVLQIAKTFIQLPFLNSLLEPLPNQVTSLGQLIWSLESQAKILLKTIGKSSDAMDAEKSVSSKLAKSIVDLSEDIRKMSKNGASVIQNGNSSTDQGSSLDKIVEKYKSILKVWLRLHTLHIKSPFY